MLEHPEEEMRIVRVPLQMTLIRRLDALIQRHVGGYETRGDFIRDAVEAQILELTYGEAPPEPSSRKAPKSNPLHFAAPVRLRMSADEGDFSSTVLRYPGDGVVIEGDAAIEQELLRGFHNRDYPSLWAAFKLAEHTSGGPIVYSDFLRTILREAWEFGSRLRRLDAGRDMKVSALFPTNEQKAQSAEAAFEAFAVGRCSGPVDQLIASGPLFLWRLAQVEADREGKNLLIALTAVGRRLLSKLDGISLDLPHAPNYAKAFFAHIRTEAPADAAAFTRIVSIVGPKGCSRKDLVKEMHEHFAEWTEKEAITNVAGYTARAREWGLFEAKQYEGRYMLTPLADELMKEGANK